MRRYVAETCGYEAMRDAKAVEVDRIDVMRIMVGCVGDDGEELVKEAD